MSIFLNNIESEEEKEEIFQNIKNKLAWDKNLNSSIKKTRQLDLWLQRICLPMNQLELFKGELCKKIMKNNLPNNQIKNSEIWNIKWIKKESKFHKIMEETNFICQKTINKLDSVIGKDEIDIFTNSSY